MDDHFSKILGPHAGKNNGPNFIASKTFEGRKSGYVFHNGDLGVGYYLDKAQSRSYYAVMEVSLMYFVFNVYDCMCRKRTIRNASTKN